MKQTPSLKGSADPPRLLVGTGPYSLNPIVQVTRSLGQSEDRAEGGRCARGIHF